MLLTLMVGCTTSKVAHATFKREYKENRFTKQFQQADSVFSKKYGGRLSDEKLL